MKAAGRFTARAGHTTNVRFLVLPSQSGPSQIHPFATFKLRWRMLQAKGRKDRHVMLPPEALGLLRQWWKVRPARYVPLNQRWLFPGRKPGQPMTTRQLNRLFHETADAAGIKKPVTLHALRHSFATHLLRARNRHRHHPGALGS